ncbi:type IV secretory system conjugative DNA transfer family protein [Nocardia transvalensis]|uniref:type IV secretory system conjugative DNA transfer family protein n=1 Tax=Nocardia transvalensis TaxID=37333 RepID=UPI001893D153|nr:TraM recognition domain-containing protein [Nocardia transvalensis]MBF6332053.1 TraM recognition domain-containing protein [Nocardia transvalensis]
MIRKFAVRGRPAVDRKARSMATRKALRPLTEAGARQKAEDLGVRLGMFEEPGVRIGTAVAGGKRLYGSYEDLHLDIWGPRQGKTSCRAIPAILDAIGPVIVTSTKRDIVDATRDVRAENGGKVWVFDPDGVAGEEPTWFWDPLDWTRGEEIRAARLAAHFAEADTRSDARDFFEIEAEELLALLFLAASVGSRPLAQVWEWVTVPANAEPVELLRRSGRHLAASGLAMMYNTDLRQRDGVFGTAKKMARCLRFRAAHLWATPDPDRRKFHPEDLIAESGTLYALAVGGRSSATPLVTALLETVLDVAARQNTPLVIPTLAVLDDAANVVRWRDFPHRCGRYGAQGVVVMTILQSWAQGVRCWGPDGMNELWSAANIKVVGGGVDDIPFLRDRADGIGGALGVPELRSLPRERAVLFASGAPAVLLATEPWWQGPHAAAVRRSIDAHGPGPTRLANLFDLAGKSVVIPEKYSQAEAEPEEAPPS